MTLYWSPRGEFVFQSGPVNSAVEGGGKGALFSKNTSAVQKGVKAHLRDAKREGKPCKDKLSILPWVFRQGFKTEVHNSYWIIHLFLPPPSPFSFGLFPHPTVMSRCTDTSWSTLLCHYSIQLDHRSSEEKQRHVQRRVGLKIEKEIIEAQSPCFFSNLWCSLSCSTFISHISIQQSSIRLAGTPECPLYLIRTTSFQRRAPLKSWWRHQKPLQSFTEEIIYQI